MIRKTKRVYTPDNWHPCFENQTVVVSIHKDNLKGSRSWRVSVWGDDDFGLEKDDLTISEAFNTFRKIKDGVTQKQLRQNGFKLA